MSLATAESWDEMWDALTLPALPDRRDPYADAIISTITSLLPSTARTILELGGAPGGYLALFARLGLAPVALEQSRIGCERTRENWRLLGVEGTVIEGDLFAPAAEQYDVVYSLGLVEHFDDLAHVVAHHLKFLRPGGLIVLGCPNFRGVYTPPLRRFAPARLAVHNLDTMRVESWDAFEAQLGLTRLYRGYLGGFEPRIVLPLERPGAAAWAVDRSARALSKALRLPLLRALHRLDHPAISGYLLGAYRAPRDGA